VQIERIQEYLGVQQEPRDGVQPPAAWPSKTGTIEVDGLTARYALHLPPVLKSVSFSVKAGEKIGESMRFGSTHLHADQITTVRPSSTQVFVGEREVGKVHWR
jgi:ABC-type multidrug transport system fused ATPase/permease subunit